MNVGSNESSFFPSFHFPFLFVLWGQTAKARSRNPTDAGQTIKDSSNSFWHVVMPFKWRKEQHLVSRVPPFHPAKIGVDCTARTIMWTSTRSFYHPNSPSPPLSPPALFQPLTQINLCVCVCVFTSSASSWSVLYGKSHHMSLSLSKSVSLFLSFFLSLSQH